MEHVRTREAAETQRGRRTRASQLAPPRRDGRQDASKTYQRYHQWLRLKRLALAAFLTMVGVFFIWAIPWLPQGLDTSDYTPELAFTTYLLFGVTFTAALAMAAQELTRRHHDGLVAWASVYDEATGLHNRPYLYDRLSLECERADRNEGVFSVFVIRLQAETPLPRAAEQIESATHRSDLVALLSGSELAVLSLDVSEEQRDALLERLLTSIAQVSGTSGRLAGAIRGGCATYGVDGTDANALVHAARTAATRAWEASAQAA